MRVFAVQGRTVRGQTSYYEVQLPFASLALGKRDFSDRHPPDIPHWLASFPLSLWWTNQLVAAWHHVCRDVHRFGTKHYAGISPTVLAPVVQSELASATLHSGIWRHGDGELRA